MLSQCLDTCDKKSSTFYLWRASASALLYLCLLVLPEKKLFRIKVDDKKLKGKAPLFPTLKSLLLYVGKFTKMFIRLSLMKIFGIFQYNQFHKY